MEQTKFIMGPLQEMWVKSLEDHPERQMTSKLGEGTAEDYKACCLGELHVLGCKFFNKSLPFVYGQIRDELFDSALAISYKEYGLRDEFGIIISSPLNGTYSLATANDKGVSWPEIAAFIRVNPDAVFTHYV